MSDNTTTQNDEVSFGNGAIMDDDLSFDANGPILINMRKLDLQKYMEQRCDKTTKCMYCGRVDLYPNGMLSIGAKDRISDISEPPVWFCCECCSNMYKHETGICTMPDELFKDTFQRCYPAMYKKRYSV